MVFDMVGGVCAVYAWYCYVVDLAWKDLEDRNCVCVCVCVGVSLCVCVYVHI